MNFYNKNFFKIVDNGKITLHCEFPTEKFNAIKINEMQMITNNNYDGTEYNLFVCIEEPILDAKTIVINKETISFNVIGMLKKNKDKESTFTNFTNYDYLTIGYLNYITLHLLNIDNLEEVDIEEKKFKLLISYNLY